MPSKSERQARLMRAAAHDKEFAEKAGIDQAVAKEFVREDERLKKEKAKQVSQEARPPYLEW